MSKAKTEEKEEVQEKEKPKKKVSFEEQVIERLSIIIETMSNKYKQDEIIKKFDELIEKQPAKPKPRPPPSTSDYDIEWIRTSDSGKAQLIRYKDVDMWIPNGCFKSDLIHKENYGTQKATIQDWIISNKLKEAKNK